VLAKAGSGIRLNEHLEYVTVRWRSAMRASSGWRAWCQSTGVRLIAPVGPWLTVARSRIYVGPPTKQTLSKI
jgi:hypothetical protein